MSWQRKPRIREPRPGYERLRELVAQELVRVKYHHGDLMPAAEFRALLCRASRRLLAERSTAPR